MNRLSIYKPDMAILPGATLIETLDSIGMSQKELSERMNRPAQAINEIIKGEKQITYETAIQFERILNIPASFWLNLEQNYRTTLERIEDEKRLIGELYLVRNYPYQEMARLGWVSRTEDRAEQHKNLLNYFGVQSLKLVKQTEEVAFRVAHDKKFSPYTMAAWLRRGEILAREIETKEFNKNKLQDNIDKLRRMTILPPNKFETDLVKLCSESGISLVFIPHLKKTHVQGSTKWLTSSKALIQLSLRYKYNDIFWFTFFHELAHIILHGKKDKFLDLEDTNKEDKKELEANKYAEDTLIPFSQYQGFLLGNDYSKLNIINFAKTIGIDPAIVVGRLQYNGKIGFNQLNDLRSKFVFIKRETSL